MSWPRVVDELWGSPGVDGSDPDNTEVRQIMAREACSEEEARERLADSREREALHGEIAALAGERVGSPLEILSSGGTNFAQYQLPNLASHGPEADLPVPKESPSYPPPIPNLDAHLADIPKATGQMGMRAAPRDYPGMGMRARPSSGVPGGDQGHLGRPPMGAPSQQQVGMRAMTPEEKEYHDAQLDLDAAVAARKRLYEDAQAGPTQSQRGDIMGSAKTTALLPLSPATTAKGLYDGLTRAEYEEGKGLDVAEDILDGVGGGVGGHVYRSWKEELEKGYEAWRRGENPGFNPAGTFFDRMGEIGEAWGTLWPWPSGSDLHRADQAIYEALRRRDAAEAALRNRGRFSPGGGRAAGGGGGGAR